MRSVRSIRFGWPAAAVAALLGCGGGKEAPPTATKAVSTEVQPSSSTVATTPPAGTPAAGAATSAAAPATTAPPPSTASAPPAAGGPTASAPPGAAPAAAATLPFLAPDFIGAIHLRPAKILASPLAKKIRAGLLPPPPAGAEGAAQAFQNQAAKEFSKRIEQFAGLEEVWIYVDPNPMGNSPAGFAAVLKSKAPLSAKEFGGEWMPQVEQWTEAEVEGKKFRSAPGSERELGSPFAIHQADDKTLLLGPEDVLLRVLTSKPGPSPLSAAAAKTKFDGGVTVVAVPGPFKPLLEKAKAFLEEQTLVAPYSKLPEFLPHLESAALKLSLEGPELLVLDVALDDEAAGAKLKETLDEVWTEGKIFLGMGAQQAKAQIGAKAEGFVKELREKVVLAQEGGVTTVKLGLPTTLEAAVDEAVSEAIPKIRDAAKRVQRLNNLRQVLLAMHIHLSEHNKLPADYVSADGKPLLSWRVRILPYLEQKALFDQFKLDEPWDSPHNKPLSETVVAIFETPGAKPGTTSILAFVGPETAFPKPGESLSIEKIVDGASNTLAVVAAKPEKAVPWTQPSDLAFDAEKLQELLDALPEKEILAGFFDGHVEVLKERPKPPALKAMVTVGAGDLLVDEPEAK